VSESARPADLRRLVCASANPHKVAEIEALLAGVVELLPRPAGVPDVVEDADTLVGNARLKAIAIAAAAGEWAVSDDTGLFVDALGGLPGVHTARYAGPSATDADNRRRLVAELDGRGPTERVARFVTVVMIAAPDGREFHVEGVCTGHIALAERGERGFGYDPLFVPDDGDGRTFAEMTEVEKHAISHRGRAFAALADLLRR
jgi:XTP/dITP diphosphohydrolase